MSKSQTACRRLLLGKIEIRKFLEPCTIFQYYYPNLYVGCNEKFFYILFLIAQMLILTQQERGNFSMGKCFKLKKKFYLLNNYNVHVGINENQITK